MSRRRLRAYLSGGMEYARKHGAPWRQSLGVWLKRELGHSVFDPTVESDRFLSRYYPGVDLRRLKSRDTSSFVSILHRIVRLDLSEIERRSDYVICHWDRSAQKGAGTKGEISLAYHVGKPVYVVTRHRLERIPGWVLGCTTRIFPSLAALKRFLTSRYRPPRRIRTRLSKGART